ncbi:ABC transporter substrate-binding protein [Paenibacillus senegalensis]|uniref:ABC transporter substrate-binding protein n=1 Tax=Paenibacillus senegalensis TaxID=1465766 RepID=UPI000287FE6A|nr:ABC transporter substrate-binding protein [Paenibacillus senegalensis]
MMVKQWKGIALGGLLLLAAGCGNSQNEPAAPSASPEASPEPQVQALQVVLDWAPNTNHTGLYVAVDQGYFAEEGLEVEIIQPGMSGADAMVASGEVPFGVSYQENVTHARAEGVPLVSIAAVIQHNTSGFASAQSKNITRPKDFEGKTYAGWGGPAERAVIESVMLEDGGDVNEVSIINAGDIDFFTAMHQDIDFAWIFYAWTGIEAELRNEPINMIYVNEYSDSLDYYTPVLITNEKMIAEEPETVEAFMRAVSKGYEYAIDHPREAGEILVSQVPDLDEELVLASQEWLATRYQAEAEHWGLQKEEVWTKYAQWMLDYGLMENEPDIEKAFTNEFIPGYGSN